MLTEQFTITPVTGYRKLLVIDLTFLVSHDVSLFITVGEVVLIIYFYSTKKLTGVPGKSPINDRFKLPLYTREGLLTVYNLERFLTRFKGSLTA
jgi:hypothetical protein